MYFLSSCAPRRILRLIYLRGKGNWIDMTASAVVDLQNTFGAGFIGLFVSSVCVWLLSLSIPY
jgi:hypothetical protein